MVLCMSEFSGSFQRQAWKVTWKPSVLPVLLGIHQSQGRSISIQGCNIAKAVVALVPSDGVVLAICLEGLRSCQCDHRPTLGSDHLGTC
jgi:hypothetical protein